MIPQQIPASHEQIVDFCRRWHIRKLSFFGSVSKDDVRYVGHMVDCGQQIEQFLASLAPSTMPTTSRNIRRPCDSH